MIGFARFTAIVFIVLGLALIALGVAGAVAGRIGLPALVPSVSNAAGLLGAAGVIAGGVVALQGLVLIAVGEVLWLMAGLSYKTQLSIEYLAEAVNRLGNVRKG